MVIIVGNGEGKTLNSKPESMRLVFLFHKKNVLVAEAAKPSIFLLYMPRKETIT